MDAITIRPLSGSRDTKEFIRFLWTLYGNDPVWVPPLWMDRKKLMDRKKNPFYQHADAEFFLAERGGVTVGRIAAIVNHNHNKEHNDKVGFFGFFESIDDQSVANALLDKAKEYLQARGMNTMRGPVTPSVNDEYGLLVEGFDKPAVILMPYNPPYYIKLLEGYGLTKVKDLFSYLLNQDKVYSEKLERVNNLVKDRHNLVFRPLDIKHFDDEVQKLKDVYNKAWMYNWGAVQMTDAEISALAADLKPIVVPDLLIFAEKDGKTIGFGLSLPDINIALKHNKRGWLIPGLMHLMLRKKEINLCRIIALGVLPEYLYTGAAGVLFYETAVRAKKLGYYFGDAGWILEDNEKMIRAAKTLNGEPYKRYRLYEMSI